MKSKLSPDKFPIANPFEWLVFANPWQRNIDFVFACRLAALAKHIGKKINISSGHRSTEEQIKEYMRTGGRLVNGVWVGGNGKASKPDTSYHEMRLAIDTSDPWLKQLEKDLATLDQKTLMMFGLFKLLTKGNKVYSGSKLILEDWHIQPIETLGIKDKKSLAPDAYNELKKGAKGFEVLELQWRLSKAGYKLIADSDFGMITDGAIKDFQRTRGLVADGIVGQKTWDKLYEC